jgi:hypothetical protein
MTGGRVLGADVAERAGIRPAPDGARNPDAKSVVGIDAPTWAIQVLTFVCVDCQRIFAFAAGAAPGECPACSKLAAQKRRWSTSLIDRQVPDAV